MSIDMNVIAILQDEVGEDLVYELIGLYFEESPTLLTTLQQAFDQDDRQSIVRAAHKLKSMSAQLGALELSHTCQELETMAPTADTTALNSCLNLLTSKYQQSTNQLSALQQNTDA
ncbi:MAG: Hpt domain-containing protein [Chloroflexaceae bacterium]|nr:Hpt domain-containing protein [Chloroflexaceae bacterium]